MLCGRHVFDVAPDGEASYFAMSFLLAHSQHGVVQKAKVWFRTPEPARRLMLIRRNNGFTATAVLQCSFTGDLSRLPK
jgi:hypothetical protein